VKEVWLIVKQV